MKVPRSVSLLKKRKDQIEIDVIDSGCGIPEAEQSSVFDRFESKSRGSNHRGAGLGLSIVKSLVEAHSGAVNLSSHEGMGTTITISLPVKQIGTGSDKRAIEDKKSALDEKKSNAA